MCWYWVVRVFLPGRPADPCPCSLKEFMAATKRTEYKEDQGWEGIPDREHEFDSAEFEEYSRHRQLELVSTTPVRHRQYDRHGQ